MRNSLNKCQVMLVSDQLPLLRYSVNQISANKKEDLSTALSKYKN
jgi:hypothetical protein